MKTAALLKRVLLAIMALSMLLSSLIIPGITVSAATTGTTTNVSLTEGTGVTAPVKEQFNLNEGWAYMRTLRTERDKYGDIGPDASASEWKTVNVPHTYWPTDTYTEDGSDDVTTVYYEDAWYQKTVFVPADMAGGEVWLEFEAAGHYTRVIVNGAWQGHHYGGYTTFRVNITNAVKFGQDNDIRLRIDSHTNYTPPISGDFTKFPGVTGDVSLIYTKKVYAALDDYGSSGVYVTPEVTDKDANKWNVSVDATITNASAAGDFKVKTTIRDMDKFENIGIDEKLTPFDESTMYGDKVYHTNEQTVSLESGKTAYSLNIDFDNPRLWNGKADPYRYALDFEIYDINGTLLDRVTEYFGFRYYEINEDGFFLNGESYPLRGIGYHEDYEGVGSAMTEAQWDESFKIMYEMGANFARLVHYPQEDYSYELCDRYGIVVWAEIGMISNVQPKDGNKNGSELMPEFIERSQEHLRELIRQNKNRACIVVWGLENEIFLTDYGTALIEAVDEFINGLHAIAKEEDPTRLTTQTHGVAQRWYKWLTDVNAFNSYPLWYITDTNGNNSFEGQIKVNQNKMDSYANWKDKPVGFAEYGAGGSPNHHTEYPEQIDDVYGDFHPEEWMNAVHEDAISAINNHPELWMTSIWCMFDFASSNRGEGEYDGINDKGLVTRDRKIKKDAYYLYQANWMDSDTIPVLHITSSKMSTREIPANTIKVYSNLARVELYIDGVLYSEMENKGNGIFALDAVSFGAIGETHEYSVIGYDSEGTAYTQESGESDTTWTRIASDDLELLVDNDQIRVDEERLTILFSGDISADNVGDIFTSRYNADIKLTQADGQTEVTSGLVAGGMRLVMTSESGKETKTYLFITSSIATNKGVTITASKSSNIARLTDGYIDLDNSNGAKWDSGARTGWILIDLGKEYTLSDTTLYMFKGHGTYRKYYYTISVGNYYNTENDNDLKVVAERNSSNGVCGKIIDDLKGVTARYIYFNFTGCSDTGTDKFVGVKELEINGYRIVEGEAIFDYDSKKVYIPDSWGEEVYPDKLINDITVEGNAYITIMVDKYYLEDNSKLYINDFAGNSTEYSIVFGEVPPYSGDTYSSLAWLILMLTSGSVLAIAFISRRKATR